MLTHLLPLLFGSGCCLHGLWHRCRCWHCKAQVGWPTILRGYGWALTASAALMDRGLVAWLVPWNVAFFPTAPSLGACGAATPSPAALDRPFLLGPVTAFTVLADSEGAPTMCQVPQRQRESCQDPSMHSQWRKGSQRECPYPVPTPVALCRPCPRPGASLHCILS